MAQKTRSSLCCKGWKNLLMAQLYVFSVFCFSLVITLCLFSEFRHQHDFVRVGQKIKIWLEIPVLVTTNTARDGPTCPPKLQHGLLQLPMSKSLKGPILYCFSSISHFRGPTTLFDMYYPKHIRGPELQLSKSCSAALYSQHSVSVPAPLNVNELRLSAPTWGALPATSLSGRGSPLC